MKPWEVWEWEFPHGSHPAVIVSPEARCANPDILTVNVAGCSTQRARREPEIHEVLLDQEDGLDCETLCRCDVLFLAKKSELKRPNIKKEPLNVIYTQPPPSLTN